MGHFLTCTSVIALIAIPAAAQAQAAPVAAPANGAPVEERGLTDIVVTAQRRSESLQRTALAVSAVDGAAIRNAGVSQPQDLTKLIPALQLSPLGAGGTQVTIRGVGNFAPFIYSEAAVAINYDGVYLARSAAPNGLFYDLERVEVLKGPQGTLYGRNATGGAINVVVARPRLGETAASGDFEIGNYGLKRGSAMINLPIGDKVALRVAGQAVDRHGYLSDGYLDDVGQAVRGQLRFVPSSDLRINLFADYIHQGGKGPGGVFVTPAGFLDPSDPYKGPTSPASNALLRGASLGISGGTNPNLLPPFGTDGFTNVKKLGLNATIEYDMPVGTLTVIPAYRFTRNDFKHYAGGFPLTSTERSKQQTLEVRLSSPSSSAIKWVVGGYYFHDNSTLFVDADQGITRTITTSPGLPVRSLAAFGQLTVPLSDTFRATAGARYTNEKKSQTGINITRLPALPVGFPAPPAVFYGRTCPAPGSFDIAAGTCTGPFSGELEFNRVTYKVGLEHDLSPNSLLFASMETGFKAGGFYPSLPVNTFAPETIRAFTIGSKNRFADNTLQLNIEAFYWKYDNKHVTHLGPIRPAGFSIITENAGKATIYGAEADLTWRPTRDDRLNVNLQYVHSRFDRFVYNAALPGAPGSVAAVSCPQTPGVDPVTGQRFATVDCAGYPLAQTPRWVLNASYQRRIDLGQTGRLDAIVGTRLQSSYFTGEEYLPGHFQGDSMVSYASLTYRTHDDRFSLGTYVENIENEAVKASSFVQPAIGIPIVILRPPRTYGVRAGFRFSNDAREDGGMITLHGHSFSRAHRVLWMLKELGVAFEHVPTDFRGGATRTPEHLAINPNGRVPALVDGDLVLFESLAINLYLARRYGGPLAPDGIAEEALATQWSFWVATEVEKPLLLAAANLMLFGEGERDSAQAALAVGKLDRPFRVLDAHLAKHDWLIGERFTVADLNVSAVMTLIPITNVPIGDYPALAEWLERCLERPAAADWKPITFAIPRPPTEAGILAMFV